MPLPEKPILGQHLEKYLQKHKMLQKDFAALIGVQANTLSQWATGKRQPDNATLVLLAKTFGVSVDELLGVNPFDNFSDVIFPITRKRFRMLGDISCGQPRYTDEDHETYIEAADNIQADFCLRAKGDSMIGARINDGDIVFIREQPMVEDGEIAAVIIDDEATLKRVKYNKEKQQLTLFPANDKYDPLVFIGEELNQIRILGKAVCFMSNL